MDSFLFPTDYESKLQQDISPYLKTISQLDQSIKYSLFNPGKRIRAKLVFASARLFDLEKDISLIIAHSIECIHCFSLIHDDLPCMDNDDFRRGKLTNHKVYGEGTALLAGDALLSTAYQYFFDRLAQHQKYKNFFQKAYLRLLQSTSINGMIDGQALELELEQEPDKINIEALKKIYALKTGALFKASILIPADLLGIKSKSEKYTTLERYAETFGVAFQVIDDLQDEKQDLLIYSASKKNILSHLSKPDAIGLVKNSLHEAQSKINLLWPEKSQDYQGLTNTMISQING